jgi:hypothetical protein
VAIAVISISDAFRNYLKEEGKATIARTIWIRMSIIFAAVGIGLFFVQEFSFRWRQRFLCMNGKKRSWLAERPT